MRDVAERAGVGMMTVSRVLNGTAQVRDETKERVYRALEELHYRPNLMARALRGFGTRSIGVILPYLFDPFFASCAHAISTVAKQHAYSVLLATSDENTETEAEQVRDLLRRQVEGIIVFPASNGDSHLTDPEFLGTPMVAVDRPLTRPASRAGSRASARASARPSDGSAPSAPVDSVLVENQQGATLATEHLIQHGHRRVLYIGLNRRIFTMQSRVEGYMKAMQTAGLEPECFDEGHDEAATVDFVRSVRSRANPPTAIFAANGLSTRHALHAIASLDMRVPEEMAFIGFDDFDLADILRPALTVVRQPIQRVGEESAELLFARLDNPTNGKPNRPAQRRTLPVELVLRRSCGCHPA
jgi:LacI family transcriptional regulator